MRALLRRSLAVGLSFIPVLFPPTAVSAQKGPAVPEGVSFETGIEYSNPDDQHLQLNMARPKAGDGPFPAVICIHGGGFRAGKREGYDGLCMRLAQHGYVAMTVSYRLAPKYPFPAAIHDVKAAVRWARANAAKYHIDPARIGVTGGSAGGHLAQFLGVTGDVKEFEGSGGNADQSSKVACVVNVYGPSDFTRSYGKSVDAAEVLPLFLGGNLETARPQHIRASPLNWVTPNAAPTLCIHGTDDRYVAHEQAEWMVDRLRACGVEADLLTLPGAGHGFKGKDAETAENSSIAFFDRHLKRKSVRASEATPSKKVGHRLLVADDSTHRIAIVNAAGIIEWEHKIGPIHDLHLLPSGNVLFQLSWTRIVEMDPKTDKIVWEYDAATNNGNSGKKVEVHSFQRLEGGVTMIAESGPARIIEVDAKGRLLRQVPLQVSRPHPHTDTRLVRKLENGNYLVAQESEGAVREYDPVGKIVWEYAVPLFDQKPRPGHGPEAFGNSVFAALRLPGGNTLIATGNGHSVLEVTPKKEIVWHLKQDDLPKIKLAWVTTLQVLPSGNIVLGNCHAGKDNPQVIEITRDKQIAWSFSDFKQFGNSTPNSQVLDVPGKTLR